MNTENNSSGFLVHLVIFVFGVGSFLFNALVFMDLWNWFPAELGVPTISYALSVGLFMMIRFTLFGMFSHVNALVKEIHVQIFGEERYTLLQPAIIFAHFVVSLIIWGVGAYVHQFV